MRIAIPFFLILTFILLNIFPAQAVTPNTSQQNVGSYLLSNTFAPSASLSNLGYSGSATSAGHHEPSLHVGGAVRYNLLLTNYESGTDATSGAFTFDTWRINVVYDNPGGIGLNFEYRFYPTFGTHFIKQGWLDYSLTDQTEVQLGVTQVPFGNLQYNSNSWWFSLAYYVGRITSSSTSPTSTSPNPKDPRHNLERVDPDVTPMMSFPVITQVCPNAISSTFVVRT